MSDPLFSELTLRTLRQALDGLSRRQEVIADNLANGDTPGYQARTVDFETALRRAEADGAGLRLRSTHAGHLSTPVGFDAGGLRVLARPGGTVRADGNNVNVDQELMELSATGIEYQALTQLVSRKLQLLKSIATGR
jgi:flagellar basal-body rod protein FlgB